MDYALPKTGVGAVLTVGTLGVSLPMAGMILVLTGIAVVGIAAIVLRFGFRRGQTVGQ